MSNQVAPQIDVGNLTLQSLGAFLPVLATLSADDVQPMAMPANVMETSVEIPGASENKITIVQTAGSPAA